MIGSSGLCGRTRIRHAVKASDTKRKGSEKDMTSAELNKELKKLQSERTRILQLEEMTSLFVAATTENVEEIRPEYDLRSTDEALLEKEKQIRAIKHRLNVFNSTHVIEELGMTIDEVLIYLPQQSERVSKLAGMAKHTSRQRCSDRYGSRNNLIEYEYANFDQAEAQRLYDAAHNELVRFQIALDRENTTVEVP